MGSSFSLSVSAIVEAQLDAYRARDVKAFAAFYSNNIKVYRNDELWIDGLQDLKIKYGQLFDLSPELSIRISERRIQDDTVFDTEHIKGLRGNPDEIVAYVSSKVTHGKISEVRIKR